MAVTSDQAPFGEVLRRLRVQTGLTQEELAECAGLSAHGISDLERGARNRPYRSTIERLVKCLHLEPDQRELLVAAARHADGRSGPLVRRVGWAAFPRPLSSLVGRQRELGELRGLVRTAQLVTLTGAGGSGKTRLALAVAEMMLGEFEDGVTFVDLTPIHDPAVMLDAVAQGLGVRETAGRDLLTVILDAIALQCRLLVLDNFEQVLPSASLVGDLLRGGAQLRAVVTSRAPLRISGEHEYQVAPLELPALHPLPAVDHLAHVPAVTLFVERTRAVMPTFRLRQENAATIADVCVRLDGLPLALELAAARMKILSLSELSERLRRSLALLSGGPRDANERHQTLWNALEWTWELLEPRDRTLFRRLAVFVGGWTLQAAEEVCASHDWRSEDLLDALGSLVDWSLVQSTGEPSGGLRFGILQTIREYGREQLAASGELHELQRRHADFFLALAEQSQPELRTREQATRLEQLEREHDNLRAAVRWCVDNREAERGLRLGAALAQFWLVHDHLTEGRDRLREILDIRGGESVTGRTARAAALNGAGNLAQLEGDYAAAESLHRASLTIAQQLGDGRAAARSLNNLGLTAQYRGDFPAARQLYADSLKLKRALNDRWGLASSLNNMGEVTQHQGDYAAAQLFHQESLGIARELGDPRVAGVALTNLGEVAYQQGSFALARSHYEESLALMRQLGDLRGIAYDLEGLAIVAAAEGQAERALRLAGAAAQLRASVRAPRPPAEHEQYQDRLARADCALGPSSAAAFAAGQAMSAEQATEYALGREACEQVQ